MKIQALNNIQFEVVTGMIDENTPDTTMEVLAKGDKIEIEICDSLTPPKAREIQFGDGSVAFVTKDFWKAVEIIK